MTVWTQVRARAIIGIVSAALFASFSATAPATAVSGSVQTSSIKSAVAPAKDPSLKSLAITAPKKIALKPKFKPTLLKYTATVPAGTTKVTFKPVATQKAAKVAIKAPKAYKPGANKVTFTVTAPDKKTKRVYTVTINVLRAPTITVDNASLTIVPGGFSVKVKVLNATIVPIVTKDSTPACANADPYAFKSEPDANGVMLIKVEGGSKGCALSLSFKVSPKKGYSLIQVTPIKAIPQKDAIGFNRKPYVGTADGFTVDYSVINATVACAFTSAPPSATFVQAANKLTVTGLSAGPPAQSAVIRCTFTPFVGVDPIDPVDIIGYPLQTALMTAADPVKLDDGFTVKVLALGCTPEAKITDPVGVGEVEVGDPVRNAYKVTVSGLTESQSATIDISCVGVIGQFTNADPLTITGQAATATELGLVTEPRIADASKALATWTEDQLPDPVPGTQPSILYATTPEWSPWDTSGKNVFTWQISSAQYDDAGVSCLDPTSTVTWSDLIPKIDENAWWDPSYPNALYIGDLLTSRPSVLGRCVHVIVTGVFGQRLAKVESAPAAISSSRAPTTCSTLPAITGAIDERFTTSGDVLSTSLGQCELSNGLAVSVEWQSSTVAVPSKDSDWTTYSKDAYLTVTGALNNRWLRSKVTYTAMSGSKSIYSANLAVSGSGLKPNNTVAPKISCNASDSTCTGLNVNNAILRVNSIGTWSLAGGTDLTITWQFSADGADDTWEDQTVSDSDGNALQASYQFPTAQLVKGKYRVAVTLASMSGSFDPVTVYSNVVTWATS